MTPEQMATITAAARSDDPSALGTLIQGLERQAVDNAAGVEDVTRPLRAKNAELLAKNAELTAKVATEASLAEKHSSDLAALAKTVESEKAKAASTAAGVDHSEVDKLAEELALKKFEALSREFEERASLLTKQVGDNAADRDLAVSKLRDALMEHQLFKAAPGVDPMLWRFYVQTAAPHFVPQANGEEEWWKKDLPGFDLVDPETKTRHIGSDLKPMTLPDLVKAKKDDEWQIFFTPQGQGGGGRSPGAVGETARFNKDTSAGERFGAIFEGD